MVWKWEEATAQETAQERARPSVPQWEEAMAQATAVERAPELETALLEYSEVLDTTLAEERRSA